MIQMIQRSEKDEENVCIRNLLRALPFSWKQLPLWSLGITLQTHCILRKIHEVTPENKKFSILKNLNFPPLKLLVNSIIHLWEAQTCFKQANNYSINQGDLMPIIHFSGDLTLIYMFLLTAPDIKQIILIVQKAGCFPLLFSSIPWKEHIGGNPWV